MNFYLQYSVISFHTIKVYIHTLHAHVFKNDIHLENKYFSA